jgi:hypothetical protein
VPKPKPIVLFSTNTLLAYRINEHYYDGKHFVWCNPFSNLKAVLPANTAMPPSSTPCALFKAFEMDVKTNDLHSAVIKNNRMGLLRGAEAKRKKGVITAAQEAEIGKIVKNATNQEFTPLLYVIPHAMVAKLVKPVPIADRAHPFSEEFFIEELSREAFEIVEF